MRQIIKKIAKTSFYDVYAKAGKQRMQAHAEKLVTAYVQAQHCRKLHIGCGGNTMPGWLNTDLVPYTKDIAFLDAAEKFPISDNLFDYV